MREKSSKFPKGVKISVGTDRQVAEVSECSFPFWRRCRSLRTFFYLEDGVALGSVFYCIASYKASSRHRISRGICVLVI